MNNEQVVLNTSDEAASIKTVTGWVDRHGRFWGDDERIARYSGCTHVACSECGKPSEKHYTKCSECRELAQVKQWDSFEKKPWDGETPVTLHIGDEYFFDSESFYDWCLDQDIDPKTVQLVHCKPQYLRQVDEDHWCDDLAEDGELPNGVQAALDALNAAIREHDEPVSWWPSKVAVDPESLDGVAA